MGSARDVNDLDPLCTRAVCLLERFVRCRELS